MSLPPYIALIISTIVNLFQLLVYPSTPTVTTNLKHVSASAKTYEEWLLYQQELDALSGRNIWSVWSDRCHH